MRSSITFLSVAGAASIVLAQQTPAQLAAQIPDCVLPCDHKGFEAVGCSETDYPCHCTHSDDLKTIVGGCLANSTCTGAELATFGGLVAAICQNLNVTTNGTISGPSPTPTPSTTVVPVSGGLVGWAPLNGAVFVAAISGLLWIL